MKDDINLSISINVYAALGFPSFSMQAMQERLVGIASNLLSDIRPSQTSQIPNTPLSMRMIAP
jgi:hypothetical protein